MSVDRRSQERALLAAALTRTGEGDRVAFQEVYRRTSAKLFGLCLRIFDDREEAEDALQDIYILIWRKAGQYDPARSSPITWLATLARNRAFDRLRSSGRKSTSPLDEIAEPVDESASVLETMLDAERDHRITDCLEELPAADAGLIRTAFFQGKTYPEIAEMTSNPLGTIKSRIRRALMRLRGCLA